MPKIVFHKSSIRGWILEVRFGGGAGFSSGRSFYVAWNAFDGSGELWGRKLRKRQLLRMGWTKEWKSLPRIQK